MSGFFTLAFDKNDIYLLLQSFVKIEVIFFTPREIFSGGIFVVSPVLIEKIVCSVMVDHRRTLAIFAWKGIKSFLFNQYFQGNKEKEGIFYFSI